MAAILADPAARRVAFEDGRGTLVVTPTGEGVLVMNRLEARPEGEDLRSVGRRAAAVPSPPARSRAATRS